MELTMNRLSYLFYLNQVLGQLNADYTLAHAHDLCVVALSGTLGGERIVAYCRTDTGNLVGNDAHAETGAAYQDTALELAAGNCFSDLLCNVGIKDHFTLCSAEILVFDVFLCVQMLHDGYL